MSEPQDEIGKLIRAKATRHAAPAHLRSRVDAMLAQEGIGLAVTKPATRPQRDKQNFFRTGWHRWVNMSGAFAVGMVASVALMLALHGNGEDARIEQAVVDNHVRSLMGAHLVDVVSSDKHTVKPWFAGKLDYAPPVRDLAQMGVPLIGGRLDYLGQRPVAALVYRVNQHAINVFVWPQTENGAKTPEFSARQGYNVVRWRGNGMQFWVISDLNATELHKVVDLLSAADQP